MLLKAYLARRVKQKKPQQKKRRVSQVEEYVASFGKYNGLDPYCLNSELRYLTTVAYPTSRYFTVPWFTAALAHGRQRSFESFDTDHTVLIGYQSFTLPKASPIPVVAFQLAH